MREEVGMRTMISEGRTIECCLHHRHQLALPPPSLLLLRPWRRGRGRKKTWSESTVLKRAGWYDKSANLGGPKKHRLKRGRDVCNNLFPDQLVNSREQ